METKQTLHELCELINKHMRVVIDKQDLTPDLVKTLRETVGLLKDVKDIELGEDGGYSQRRPYYYDHGGSYGNRNYDMAYADRRNSYGEHGDPYRKYYIESYNDRGNSRHGGRQSMIEHLEEAMEHASTEQEREDIHKMLMRMK